MFYEDVMPYPDELKSSEVFKKQRADHALPGPHGDSRALDFVSEETDVKERPEREDAE